MGILYVLCFASCFLLATLEIVATIVLPCQYQLCRTALKEIFHQDSPVTEGALMLKT